MRVRPMQLFVAMLISLVFAIAPVAGLAMATSCSCPSQFSAIGAKDHACHGAMPDCGDKQSCRTAGGCAVHCFGLYCVVPAGINQSAPLNDLVTMVAEPQLSSLSIRPPPPPPRA